MTERDRKRDGTEASCLTKSGKQRHEKCYNYIYWMEKS